MSSNNLNNNITIWRYLDFWALRDLLQTSELYLCRADKLRENDPYEGTDDLLTYRQMRITENLFMNSNQKKLSQKMNESISKKIFISCWHMNEIESFLMWHVYAHKGFAIKTNVGRLKKSLLKFNKKEKFRIDRINYISLSDLKSPYYKKNYFSSTESNNPLEEKFFYKIESFQDEKELRVLSSVFNSKNNVNRQEMRLQCDLIELIEDIYISPFLKEENLKFKEMKKDINVLMQERMNKNISQSSLQDNFIENYQITKKDFWELAPEVIRNSSFGLEAQNAKYRLKYQPQNGEITGCLPTNVLYPNDDIDDNNKKINGSPFIEVDWKTWMSWAHNQQQYKIDPFKKILVKK